MDETYAIAPTLFKCRRQAGQRQDTFAATELLGREQPYLRTNSSWWAARVVATAVANFTRKSLPCTRKPLLCRGSRRRHDFSAGRGGGQGKGVME